MITPTTENQILFGVLGVEIHMGVSHNAQSHGGGLDEEVVGSAGADLFNGCTGVWVTNHIPRFFNTIVRLY